MGRSRASAAKLEAALAELETLDLDGLRVRWRSIIGTPAPPSFRVALLRAAVAYKLQERVLGGLKPSTRALLRRTAEQADPGSLIGLRSAVDTNLQATEAGGGAEGADRAAVGSVGEVLSNPTRRQPALRIKPGTRLLRTWQGSTHEVLVGQGEVTYRGQRYRSLSEVARTITGQRWSGPLFFGLKGRAGRRQDRATNSK